MSESSKGITWVNLGDLGVGRPNMGTGTDVMVYRLFQFSVRHVLEDRLGIERTEELMREAGEVAGRAFAASQLDKDKPFFEYVADLQRKLADLKVGILRIEKADLEKLEFVLTVSEDLDCSGLPITGKPVCTFDEGFIAAIAEHYLGRKLSVREVDCWATGAKTCRFEVKAVGQ
ncbi:V4R domain-containing protein [Methanomassiliicoccus luminyensis]|uniref:V4R domain-containing protein n=1 Tax=Methanomassiliicoccus luminyensis TaxID=1080712 RepID=UPI0003660128|nr:V4R domain-containing protein [Methanomassiliicoccus luminyensis]